MTITARKVSLGAVTLAILAACSNYSSPPELEDSRVSLAAIANLRQISTTEASWKAGNGRYASLDTLIESGMVDERFRATVAGYTFEIVSSGESFTATATPTAVNDNRYAYYCTEDGVVRYSMNVSQAPAGQSGQPSQW